MCLSPMEGEEDEQEDAPIEWNTNMEEQKDGSFSSRSRSKEEGMSPRLTARQEEKLSESKAGRLVDELVNFGVSE